MFTEAKRPPALRRALATTRLGRLSPATRLAPLSQTSNKSQNDDRASTLILFGVVPRMMMFPFGRSALQSETAGEPPATF